MALTIENGKWKVTPNVSTDITLNTTNRYLDRNIVIKSLSAGTAATWTNVTSTSNNSYLQLVSAAGYTPVKYISALTLPSGKSLTTLTNNGTITSYAGGGAITTYTNTGTINTMTGSRTITNMNGTLNITYNTGGAIHAYGGKTKDKGVSIEEHVVTVDGGTAVTNSSGDLITTSLAGAGGAVRIKSSSTNAKGTNVTITDSDTDTGSGIYIDTGGSAVATRAAVTYTNSTAGWLTAHTSATTISAAADSSATTLSANKYYLSDVTLNANKSFTVNMNAGATLTLKDSLTGNTWLLKIDSENSALDFIFRKA